MAAEQRRTLLDKWQLMKRLDCDPRLSRADLAVMRAILDRLNDEGICWPSFDTLAGDTEQARRSAVRSIERLIRCGWLEDGSRRGRGRRNHYRPVWGDSLAASGAAASGAESDSLATTGSDSLAASGAAASAAESDSLATLEVADRSLRSDSLATRTLFTIPDTNPTHNRRRRGAGVSDDLFERFWQAYPSRGDHPNPKKPARDQFVALIARGVEPELIIEAAGVYAAKTGNSDRRFVCQAATWLRQERFNDREKSEMPREPSRSRKLAISDDEWRRRLEAWRGAGAVAKNWPKIYGLPPTHPATDVPRQLREEFGLA